MKKSIKISNHPTRRIEINTIQLRGIFLLKETEENMQNKILIIAEKQGGNPSADYKIYKDELNCLYLHAIYCGLSPKTGRWEEIKNYKLIQ